MGNRIGKLFGSRSGSEDITAVPNKPKKENSTPSSNVTKTVPPTVVKPVPTPTVTSETVTKDTVAPEVLETKSSAVVTNSAPTTDVESRNTETSATHSAPDNANELPAFLIVLLKKIAEQEGFTDYTFEVSAGSNHADGFLAVIKRVIVSGSRNGTADKLPLICKLMPTSKARREQFNSDAVFIREAFMYSKLLPLFAEFQKEKGLSATDSFCEYPKCYGTLDDKQNDHFVIVLEDLKASGYLMFDKLKAADFNHVRLFAESLGKFHAVSFALKDQRPEVFAQFKPLQDVFVQQVLDKPEEMGQMFAFFFDKAIGALKPEDTAEIKAMTELKANTMEELKATASGEAAEPFSIVNHGDCWNNNMMYVYGSESDIPVNISLLDFQISRYSSPALDLVYFLFSSTDKTLRDSYYTEVIQLYHKALSTNLTKLGSDAEKLFSFNDLQDQLKKFGRYALIIAPMLLNIITSKPDDIPDLDNLAEEFKDKSIEEGMKAFINDSANDKFNGRMRDVIQDVIRLGYYDKQ
ncbi:uncharacterized protein LOC119085637 isoform X2 [Bradysia coprophila]|uniref:uncharacterized protein LOC119085637 isoform X2 n=1 Tax=Bradysia coprophila TaxID=38358 RepID=UPI00187DB2BB|nr:uncharacterized protein LOC119085637 isoform X2 [Bradysia coprophila]